MSVNVKLSVIGFFHEIVNRPVTVAAANPTVKDVLDAFAAAVPEVFEYQAIPSPFIKLNKNGQRRKLVFAITYKGYTLDTVISPILGTVERVWQFYVETAQRVNQGNKDRLGVDEYPVKEGETVVWRLVTVLKSPARAPKRLKMGTVPAHILVGEGKPPEELEKTSAY